MIIPLDIAGSYDADPLLDLTLDAKANLRKSSRIRAILMGTIITNECIVLVGETDEMRFYVDCASIARGLDPRSTVPKR